METFLIMRLNMLLKPIISFGLGTVFILHIVAAFSHKVVSLKTKFVTYVTSVDYYNTSTIHNKWSFYM